MGLHSRETFLSHSPSTCCNVLSIIYEDLKHEGTSGLLKTLQSGKFLNTGFPSAGRDAARWIGDHPSFPLLSCLACPASCCRFLKCVKIRLRTTVQGLAIQFWEPTLIWTWITPFRTDPLNLQETDCRLFLTSWKLASLTVPLSSRPFLFLHRTDYCFILGCWGMVYVRMYGVFCSPEEFPCFGLVLLCHPCATCGDAALAELR